MIRMLFLPIVISLLSASTNEVKSEETSLKRSPLAGINLSGAEFKQNPRFPDSSNIDYYQKLGMQFFRLPVSWSRLQPELGGELDSEQIRQINRVVFQVTSADGIVAIDLHNYMRHGLDAMGNDIVGVPGSGVTQHDFADVWTRLAELYGGNDQVFFNLMNEPHNMSTRLVVENQNKAIAAIRAAGAENKVLVSANHYSGAHSFEWSDNPQYMDRITDPADNFAFDLHQYLDPNFSGTQTKCINDQGSSPLEIATQWLRSHGHQAILGEFNVGPSSVCLNELDRLLTHLNDNDDVWIGWAWWAGGGLWRDADIDDPYTIDPHPDGTVIPQLSVLQRYLDSVE